MHHKLLSPIGIGELVMRNAVLAEATLRKAAEELPEGGKVVELTDIVFDMVVSERLPLRSYTNVSVFHLSSCILGKNLPS